MPYLLGTLVLMVAIYLLGLALRLGLRGPLAKFLNVTLRRIPLIGGLYDFTHRFVGLLEQKQGDIGAMSAVWCFFGGDGVAVLALAPSAEPVDIDGRRYFAVLVPTAPVPIGGGLLYVPVEWVKPANMGIDKLTEIYVSMGLTPPPSNAVPASGRVVMDVKDAGAGKNQQSSGQSVPQEDFLRGAMCPPLTPPSRHFPPQPLANPAPMIHSLSSSFTHGASFSHMSICSRYGTGERDQSLPQNRRFGPKAS